ncbi:hypothetical protein L1D31_07100 [Vibrio sp. Isolate23]|uniref:hypothetical protein n=1 Tax=Vibrio sp. Isolate23 TaxID=2908533 RepID=UPI001EFC9089|nr:hypothetical protein [Vibrio sp. Isolate23]MCG9682337.1 hypothetical protein [Vibrio sp. Isolate23]
MKETYCHHCFVKREHNNDVNINNAYNCPCLHNQIDIGLTSTFPYTVGRHFIANMPKRNKLIKDEPYVVDWYNLTQIKKGKNLTPELLLKLSRLDPSSKKLIMPSDSDDDFTDEELDQLRASALAAFRESGGNTLLPLPEHSQGGSTEHINSCLNSPYVFVNTVGLEDQLSYELSANFDDSLYFKELGEDLDLKDFITRDDKGNISSAGSVSSDQVIDLKKVTDVERREYLKYLGTLGYGNLKGHAVSGFALTYDETSKSLQANIDITDKPKHGPLTSTKELQQRTSSSQIFGQGGIPTKQTGKLTLTGLALYHKMNAVLLDYCQNNKSTFKGVVSILAKGKKSDFESYQQKKKGLDKTDTEYLFISYNYHKGADTNPEFREGQSYPLTQGSYDNKKKSLKGGFVHKYNDLEIEIYHEGVSNTKFSDTDMDQDVIAKALQNQFHLLSLNRVVGANMEGPVGTITRNTSGRGNNCLFHATWLSTMAHRINGSPNSEMTQRQNSYYNSYRRANNVPVGRLMDLEQLEDLNAIRQYVRDLGVSLRIYQLALYGEWVCAHTIVNGHEPFVAVAHIPQLNHFMACYP